MFPRIETSHKRNKTYQYLVISESIRKNGQSTNHDIARLGNIERFRKEDVKNIIDGLIKIFQLEEYSLSDEVEMIESLEHGSIIFWRKFWQEMKLSTIIGQEVQRRHRSLALAVERYVEMMTINRCAAPDSKLGVVTRWLPTTSYKEMKDYADLPLEVNYFYRSMDYLIEVKDAVEKAIFERLRNLFSVTVKLTFYDITSTFFYGDQCPLGELGYSRDDRPGCEQVVVGVVTSYEGYPLKHYVFTGSTPDKTTVKKVVANLKQQFHIEQTIFVGDRGMITKLNLDEIEGHGFDYIMGVKMRQDALFGMLLAHNEIEFSAVESSGKDQNKLQLLERRVAVKYFLIWRAEEILQDAGVIIDRKAFANLEDWVVALKDAKPGEEENVPDWKQCRQVLRSISTEVTASICQKVVQVVKGYVGRYERAYRFIICLNPQRQRAARDKRKKELKIYCQALDKVVSNAPDKPVEVVEQTLHKVFDSHKAKKYRKFFVIERDFTSRRLTGYSLNEAAVDREEQLDGVFALLSKRDDLSPQKVVESYKNLKEVETLFDDFKNFVDVRPIRHWRKRRVQAHVFICILALLLKRILEIHYLGSKSLTEPLAEIAKVKLIRYKIKYSEREERHRILPKVTNINPQQKKYFNLIGLKNPSNLELFMW